MKKLFFAACLMAAGAAVQAAGSGIETIPSLEPEWTPARKALADKDFKAALPLLERLNLRVTDHPEVLTQLAFAQRKTGNVSSAMRNYRRALQLEPNLKNAHEYIGEAYLMQNDPQRAKFHLAALERLCGTDCEEYRDLKEAFEAFEAKGPSGVR